MNDNIHKPASNFTPAINSAPDLVVVEQAFVDNQGRVLTVDNNLRLEVSAYGDSTCTISDKTIGDGIEFRTTGHGTFYFAKIDPADFNGNPFQVKWFAQVNGRNHIPYPVVQTVQGTTTQENILLASELKYYTLNQLGWPAVAIELEDSHVAIAIEDALREYNRWLPKFDRRELRLNRGQNRYTIEDYGRGVVRVDFVQKEGVPLLSDPLFGRYYPNNFYLEFDQYTLGTSFYKTLLSVTGQGPEWRWDEADPTTLLIFAELDSYKAEYWFARDHRLEEVPTEYHQLFRDMCVAVAKRQLGTIRAKYGNSIAAPGGEKQLDGEQLKTEAQTSLERLREQFKAIALKNPPIRG